MVPGTDSNMIYISNIACFIIKLKSLSVSISVVGAVRKSNS